MFYKENFRELRKGKKIFKRKFAQLLGVSERTLQHWEAGTRSPGVSDIRIMCRILNVGIKEISDIDDLDFSSVEMALSKNPQPSNSFVDKIEGALSIPDRIFLNGINAELQTLRNEVRKIGQEASPSEAIADEISSLIYKKDLDGKFTYINKPYAKFLNSEANTLLGKNNREIFGWQEAEKLDELEAEAIRGPSISNRQIAIPGSMKKRYGLLSTSSIYAVDGMLKEIVFKIEDVTDELEVFDRYRTLENVIHSSSEILWIKVSDGTYTFVSAPIHTITGYPVNEFLNNSMFWLGKVVDEYDRERVGKFYKEYESGESISYKIKANDNTTKHVKERLFRQKDLTFGIIQDVTSELKAQEDKQLLLDIIDEMPEVMWVQDNCGKNMRILTSSIDKMLGTSRNTLKADPATFINYVHEEDKEKYRKWLAEINPKPWWKSETKKSMSEKMNFRLALKNGKTKWIEETLYSTLKLKKQGIRFGIFKDVTKEYEQQLEMQYLYEYINDMDSMFWVGKLDSSNKDSFKYISLTNGVEKIYGINKKDFNNKKWIEHLHKDYAFLAAMHLSEKTFPLIQEYKITTTKGEERWISERIHKKHNLFFGLTTDITKGHEQQLEREAIIGTLDAAADGIWVTKVDIHEKKTINLYINSGRSQIYERSIEELYGDPDFWKKPLHPDDYERVVAESEDVLTGNKTQKFRLLFPDNRVKYIVETQFVKMANTIKYSGGIQREVSKKVYDQL